MKKINFTVFSIVCMLLCNIACAQYCNNSGPSVCTPSDSLVNPGFENPDSIPCIVQGVPYNQSIQFRLFTTFDYPAGSSQTIDSLEFDLSHGGIGNLPCGLCWSTNKANNRFKANEYGCINISGTTSDTVGQYKLQLNLIAWINETGSGIAVQYIQVDESGIRLWLRVQSPAGNCAPVDTSSAADNHTAACVTGINNVSDDVFSLNIIPNPLNTRATITFISPLDNLYNFKITDVTGKVVSTKEIQAKAGENSFQVERNNLPPGVYFLSLANGKFAVTRKFVVVD